MTASRYVNYYVGEAGSASMGKALDEMFNSQLARAGLISIPLTLVILLIVFGSLVGAAIPPPRAHSRVRDFGVGFCRVRGLGFDGASAPSACASRVAFTVALRPAVSFLVRARMAAPSPAPSQPPSWSRQWCGWLAASPPTRRSRVKDGADGGRVADYDQGAPE